MMLLRLASLVAAAVTIILNASYGFKSSTVLEYAILFAALNAALDLAKCSCLIGARVAWEQGRSVAAALLFLLFWPLLANSLWCGLSEVTATRSAEQTRFTTDTQARDRATAEYNRLSKALAAIEANPTFAATSACTVAKSDRARDFCTQHRSTLAALTKARADLAPVAIADPTPQLTLIVAWTGIDLSAVQLATALWPIALAELCGSLGFYLSASNATGRTRQPLRRFLLIRRKRPSPTPQNAPERPQNAPKPEPTTALRWPSLPRS